MKAIRRALIFLTVPALVTSAKAQPAVSPDLPVMDLDELGIYAVGYAFRGQAEQQFPLGWSGFFEDRTGVACEARFVQSYTNTCPYVRAAGYSEMTDHRFLTADRNVQQTVFANGVTITANFGTTPCRLASGEMLPPGGFRADGMPK